MGQALLKANRLNYPLLGFMEKVIRALLVIKILVF
jgi:hypothetical protein